MCLNAMTIKVIGGSTTRPSRHLLESHTKKTCKYSKDLAPLFATESRLPVLVAAPSKPAKAADGNEPDEADIELWKEEIKEELAKRRKCALCSNLTAIQVIIWGQCSERGHEGQSQVTTGIRRGQDCGRRLQVVVSR